MPKNLMDELQKRIVVADGAMGTQIFEKLGQSSCFDAYNISRPDAITQIHQEYLQAGSELIETNTFGANRYKLAKFNLDKKVEAINMAGARLARQSAGAQLWVAGSIGPLGRAEVKMENSEMQDIFAEQAQALLTGGVDCIILETFSRLKYLLPALKAVRNITDLPIIAQLVFTPQGKTIAGHEPEYCFGRLKDEGADIVGLNCGLGPRGALQVLQSNKGRHQPLSVFPNAGFPQRIEDRMLFQTSPEYFARLVQECSQLGANLLGGCCGTGPEHISALRQAIAQKQKTEQEIKFISFTSPTPEIQQPQPSSFCSRLGREKMVLVELDPPKNLDISKVMQGSMALKKAGVDAITLAENPLAMTRLSNVMLAGRIQREINQETIVHLTCRDRNLVGMQSTIMGMSMEAISNVLAVTGDPPSAGSDDTVRGVFDFGSYDLIGLLEKFNQGFNFHGDEMKMRSNFCIGAAYNPNTRKKELQIKRMHKKIEQGAKYFLTQPVYTKQRIDEILQLTQAIDIPIFLGIMPLVSFRNAEFLHNEFPGIEIPADIREKMKIAGDSGAKQGVEIAWELMDYAWNHFAGIYIMPPFNRYQMAVELVQRIKA